MLRCEFYKGRYAASDINGEFLFENETAVKLYETYERVCLFSAINATFRKSRFWETNGLTILPKFDPIFRNVRIKK